MDRTRDDRSLPRVVERLGRGLAASALLSFDERQSLSFLSHAKRVVGETRRAHADLAKNLGGPAQANRAIESLLDNYYIIDGALSDIIASWRRKETLRVPQSADAEGKRWPRSYIIARALVRETDGRIDREIVTAFLLAYQKLSPLSVREIDMFPDMLRFALVESMFRVLEESLSTLREMAVADRWYARIVQAAHGKRATERLRRITREIAEKYEIIPPALGFHLLQRLLQAGKESNTRLVGKWLRLALARQGMGPGRIAAFRAKKERAQFATISRAIASLRYLAQVRWDKISLSLNMVDAVLAKDPANAFLSLTQDARSSYRRTVIRIADRTGIHDVEVARHAQRLARRAYELGRDASRRKAHVGYYLAGEGIAELEDALGYRKTFVERLRAIALRSPASAYIGFISVATFLLSTAILLGSGAEGLRPFPFAVMLLSALVLSSEIASALAHAAFTRLLPPRSLPALDLSSGIGESRRTIVVIPSMFRNAASMEKVLRRIESHAVANGDPNIFYALLMDFQHADTPETSGDERLVAEASEGIARLNERYPSDIPRFAFFYRRRLWNASEKAYMGWERKRGKLREFNRLLRGKETSYAGEAKEMARQYGTVRYVITLDEDTELVRDSARALIGTIDHPLNRPVIDERKNVVVAGYGIVQPRSALRFSEVSVSAFSRLYGGFPGIEAYSSLVSDLHQDLFGDGIFHGKGVYDIDAIERTMEGRIPENTVLSHDLLEGSYARVGTASDAHIFETFPADYREYAERLHRWIRGDWQIIGWLWGSRSDVLSPVSRWRIFDNLRRSLLPVAAAAAVALPACIGTGTLAWSAAALAAIGSGQLVFALFSVAGRAADWRSTLGVHGRLRIVVLGIGMALMKTLFLASFVLHGAIVAIDAIARTLWRLFVSKRRLLEWRTAYDSVRTAEGSLAAFVRFMWASLSLALLFSYFEFSGGVSRDPLSASWTGLWLVAPALAAFMSMKTGSRPALPENERSYLYKVAARTHWFFLDVATEEERWIAPDHLQEEPPSKRHSRGLGVSPTNLGMYLLSISGAKALGLFSITAYCARMASAFESMGKMERYKGHFYNWYELRGLAPLPPQYVSSVDSANLALSLVAVRHALVDAAAVPIVDVRAYEGIRAQLGVLLESCDEARSLRDADRGERKLLDEARQATIESLALVQEALAREITPRASEAALSGVAHHVVRVENALEALRLGRKSERFEGIFLAARQVGSAVSSYREGVNAYMSYAMVPAISAVVGSAQLHPLFLKLSEALQSTPAVRDLAEGSVREKVDAAGLQEAITLSDLPPPEKERAQAWYAEMLERLSESEAKARAAYGSLLSLSEAAGRYVREMDFAFLYNAERELFHIGYNGMSGKLDEAYYDLLASEANSASIVGIAKRDVSKKHWSYLGRKLIKSGAGDTLVASWAGSLFEYLGTLIYFDVSPESFWGLSAQRAVLSHRRFAKKLGIPWGMGESASSRQDAEANYHYQAFGDPSIGFKRDLSEAVVVAPYTSALALSLFPRGAVRNFSEIARQGGFGHYGFYDAIDFTRKRAVDRNAPGIPAKIYYAHHQGFILTSIANALADGWVRRMVAKDPGMASVTQLFEEKMLEDAPARPLRSAAIGPEKLARRASAEVEVRRTYIPYRTKEAHSRFLASGEYRVRVTAGGAGESRWGEVNITRASVDMLRENVGTFFYLCDNAKRSVWSPTFMPTRTAGEKHAISANEQSIRFSRTEDGIETSLLVAPLPRAEGEIRELTIVNGRDREVELSVGVCAELALTGEAQESSHPNYEKLFVATEELWGGEAIMASRPDPKDRNRSVAAGFLLAGDAVSGPVRAVREKSAFFGSPEDKAAPPILLDPSRKEGEAPVHALDSVAGFVSTVTLKPKERKRLVLVAAAADSKDKVLEALKPYRGPRASRGVAQRAEEEGMRLLAELGVSSSEGEAYALLGSLAVARSMERGEDAGKAARPWVAPLWKLSVSGNRPIVLLHVSGVTDLPIVRQMLTCHAYFVRKGIPVDVLIFNEHAGGYLKTFEDEVDFLLNLRRQEGWRLESQIVHVRAEHLSEGEQRAILAAASVRIDAKKGSLVDGILALRKHRASAYPEKLDVKPPAKHRAGGGPGLRSDGLLFWNGYGGYDRSSREYVIHHHGKGARPPRPWSNIVSNGRFGFLSTDRGMSFTWGENSYDDKLTVPYNDALSDFTGEAIHVRDEDTGLSASPLPLSGDAGASYEIRHGEGYSVYRSRASTIGMELSMHVARGEPLKYFRLEIANDGKDPKRLSVLGYFEMLLGSGARETKKRLSFSFGQGAAIVARNEYRHQFLGKLAFVGAVGGFDEFSVSREEYLGRNGEIRHPAALKRKGLSSDIFARGEPAVALLKRIVLAPGEKAVVTFFLGETEEDDLFRMLSVSNDAERAEEEYREARREGKIALPEIRIPDETLNVLANHLLPYQITASRINARLGFYQIGGAFGYRDQLQDALALLWFDPEWARRHILQSAARQFREGDALSWWQPHNGFGARTRLSDPHLWLPYVALRYVRFTGDASILDEMVPYLSGDIPNKADRPSVVGVFAQCDEKSTLYEHLVRAVERSLNSGAHGLPLMGAADWNDGLTRVGPDGKGESVWLAWLLVTVLYDMSALAKERGDIDRANRYREHRERYSEAILKVGWDGKWYRRAFTDAGTPVGTSGAEAYRIDSTVQSWAYFSLGETKETKLALQSAKEELRLYEGHAPLAWPPSTRDVLDLGTISDYPPGVRENGSQYNHAALWLAQALFVSGDADGGKIVLDAVNPFKRSETKEKALVYQGEPYVVAAEVYSEPTYPGRAGWSWYTASAGMFYRTILENILGLRRTGDALQFAPSFPTEWKTGSVLLPLGRASYDISYEIDEKEPAGVSVTLDGARMEGNAIPFVDDGKTHAVVVRIGRQRDGAETK